MSRSPLMVALAGGVIAGSLLTATVLYAQKKEAAPPTPPAVALDAITSPFEIVDTPGSTWLLNRSTGQVWRLSFTEVQGNKYWYAMYVPLQQPIPFEEFQRTLRKSLNGQGQE